MLFTDHNFLKRKFTGVKPTYILNFYVINVINILKDIEEGKPGKVEPENGENMNMESAEEETIASREGSSERR